MTTTCPECGEDVLLDVGDKCFNCGRIYEGDGNDE